MVFSLANSPIVPGSLELLAVFRSTSKGESSAGTAQGVLARLSDNGNAALLSESGDPAAAIDYATGKFTLNPSLTKDAVVSAVFAIYLRKIVGEKLILNRKNPTAVPETPAPTSDNQAADNSSTIVVDQDYGPEKRTAYKVTALSIDPAALPGTYTFHASGGRSRSVELQRDGVVVNILRYNWRATVGADNIYVFNFPGHLQLSVTKAGTGTMNLYGMPRSIFNGLETVVVPVKDQIVAAEAPKFQATYYVQVPQGRGQFGYTSGEVTVDRFAGMPQKLVCSDFILASIGHEQVVAELLSVIDTGSATRNTYEAAGITGVTDEILDAVNALIAAAKPTPSTAEAIQAIVNAINAVAQKDMVRATHYLRNVTDPGLNPKNTEITYSGLGYFTGGVKGKPGDALEYLVVITNGGYTDAKNLVFDGKLPDFTTYTDNSVAVDTNGDETFDVALGIASETDRAGDGIIVLSGSTIKAYVGVGGNDTAGSDSGGAIKGITSAPRNKSAVRYQFTVDGSSERPVTASSSVVVDNAYGNAGGGTRYYRVTSLSVDQAAKPGTYTFFGLVPDSAEPASVDLKLNGVIVDTLTYNWQTTVGAGNVYIFDFSGYLKLSVTKDGSGTMNLYNMPESIFNDVETVVVREQQ